MNFLLPDIFDDLDMFQSWFDFSDINQKSGQDRIIKEEEEDRIISSLHTILQPFLLRRLKTDGKLKQSNVKSMELLTFPLAVEHSLPKKKEYLLYAPLTQAQKNLYDALLNRDIRNYLLKRKEQVIDGAQAPENKEEEQSQEDKRKRLLKTVDYKEKSDHQYFKELEENANATSNVDTTEAEKKQQKSTAGTLTYYISWREQIMFLTRADSSQSN